VAGAATAVAEGVSAQKGALVHEPERCRRILRFGDLVHAPIAKDSGRSSSVIRFRILHAISASASCDLG